MMYSLGSADEACSLFQILLRRPQPWDGDLSRLLFAGRSPLLLLK